MSTRLMQIYEGRRGKFKKIREHDYIYDPHFVVSGRKDFERQARESAMATAQYTIHPVFNTMFSEVKKYNSVEILAHPNARLPRHLDVTYSGTGAARRARLQTEASIQGRDQMLYTAAPRVQATMIVHTEIEPEPVPQQCPVREETTTGPQSRGVQTLFRESSAQTDPYQPDFRIHRKCKEIPEILLLQDIKFGPPEVAVHWGAVRAVQRQRVRRAWLERVMDARTLGALEDHEQRFREKELESILLLQEEKLGPRVVSVADRGLTGRRWSQGAKRLHRRVLDIRRNKERDLRKLEAKHAKTADWTCGRKQIRCPSTLIRRPLRIAVDMNYLPCNTDMNPDTVDLNEKAPLKDGMCEKMSRRNDICLEQLTQDLREAATVRSESSDDEGSVDRKTTPDSLVSDECNLTVEKQRDMDREMAANALLALLKGRAAQAKVYEGMSRNSELIKELQNPKLGHLDLHKTQELEEWFHEIQNAVIGRVLDLLNKELDHILEERRQKEFVDSAVAERQRREAAEAGRRQKEERRRMEHQEMYKEIVMVTKRAAALRLHDLFVDVANMDAGMEAEKLALHEADCFDSRYERIPKRPNTLKDEDLIAELVMDFVLPEVVKKIERTQKELKRSATPGIIADLLFSSETIISQDETSELSDACHCGDAAEEEVEEEELTYEEIDDQLFEIEEKRDSLDEYFEDEMARGDSVVEVAKKADFEGVGELGEGQALDSDDKTLINDDFEVKEAAVEVKEAAVEVKEDAVEVKETTVEVEASEAVEEGTIDKLPNVEGVDVVRDDEDEGIHDDMTGSEQEEG